MKRMCLTLDNQVKFLGVNRPAIMRDIQHFVLFPAILHFCENVPHLGIYFEKEKIRWKSRSFSAPRRHLMLRSCAKCQHSWDKRLNWYGHIKRREEDNLSRKMMDMVVPGRRRVRPRPRWIDNNREDVIKYELTADMTENRQYWKMMVKTGPQRSGDGL